MIEIKVKNPGAELVSIKVDGEEKLHDGKTFWDRQAPILFPTVGRLRDNKTIINDKEYLIPQHGFAKDMNFEIVEDTENKKVYLLESNEETLKMFPYEFKLYVTYTITDNTLSTHYKVINTGNEPMLFGIGGHPGIKIDVTKEHFFELEREENNIEFMEVEGNFISNKPAKNLLENKKIIRIKPDSFINDAIMMKNYKSRKITLYEVNENENKKIVEFDFGNYPVLALWSIPGAPYICIEPWYNFADKVKETGYFKDKEGIITLEPENEFNVEFIMRF